MRELTTFAMLLAFKIHMVLNLLVSNYTIWYMQY